MRVINVDLDNLENVVYELKYYNKRNQRKDIMKNVIYHFETEGIDFNCDLVLDDEFDLNIYKINGKRPEKNVEYLETLEYNSEDELNPFLVSFIKYGYLPSIVELEEMPIYITFERLKINYNKYDQVIVYGETLYFLNKSRELQKKAEENDISEWSYKYDYNLKIELKNINDIELIQKENNEINIVLYTDNGFVNMKTINKNIYYYINLKNIILRLKK